MLHIQMGMGGGTERFFVNLVSALAEAGAPQAVALRPGVDYAGDLIPIAELTQGHFLRRTPAGVLARRRLAGAMAGFQPQVMVGWRAPTGRLIPDRPGLKKIVRLGDYPDHVRHLRHLDAVVCNTPDIARHIQALGHTGRVEVISNFARSVHPDPVARASLDTPEEAFLVCTAARFAANKGVDTLVRAMAEVPNGWLWLVGDGPERDGLVALVDDMGLRERTRFIGWADEPMHYTAAADVFVMPSRDEPLGNALIEAWHTGTASVTTATAGPLWYGTDEQDCLIVPVDTPGAMAKAINRLREAPALRTTLARGAKASIAKQFSKEAVVEQYFTLIDSL